jgi:transcriptional regulator with XRE-family HTH domain
MTDRVKEIKSLEQEAEKIRGLIRKLKEAKLLPMAFVLSKVPGETITERADSIGISRQAYYYWLHGRSRPGAVASRKLAQLTGLPAAEIGYS